MVANLATLSLKSPLLHRFTALSRKPVYRIPSNPVQISGFRTSVSLHSRSYPLNSGSSDVQKVPGRSEIGFGRLGLGGFQVSAVPDSGSGGFGAGDGNSGGKGGGGGGEGGGSEKDGDGDGNGDGWSILSWYLALLEKYPVLTKAVTSAFLTLFGDLICQLVIDKAASLDLKRTFMFTFLGLVLVGPTLHFWYLYLSKLVTKSGTSGAMMRLLLDQFIFSPLFIGVFLSTLVTLEGRPHEVVPKLQQEWFSAVVANWQLWIPFQFLNFRFVPQQFQVLAANVVALAWNVILSFKAHKEILPKKAT